MPDRVGAAVAAEQVRSFLDEWVAPHAAAMARGAGPPPKEVVRAAGAHGVAGLLVPPRWGGSGATHAEFTAFIEAVARRCASTAVILDVHLSVATEPIVWFGDDDQRRHFLPALAAGEWLGAFAVTEAQSGSDVLSLTTRARPSGDGYELTGSKTFITNCGAADTYVLFARTGEGRHDISTFVVESTAANITCGPPFIKLGLHGSWTGELRLDGTPVPGDSRLGAPGSGFTIAMRVLDSGRIGIAAQAVGVAQGCLDAMVARGRDQGPADETLLADIGARIAASRQLTRHAAMIVDAGERATRAAAVAKLYATDTAMAAASAAVDLCAPDSAADDHPAAIRLRDAKACQIYEGTNQIQRIVIARDVLGEPGHRAPVVGP